MLSRSLDGVRPDEIFEEGFQLDLLEDLGIQRVAMASQQQELADQFLFMVWVAVTIFFQALMFFGGAIARCQQPHLGITQNCRQRRSQLVGSIRRKPLQLLIRLANGPHGQTAQAPTYEANHPESNGHGDGKAQE